MPERLLAVLVYFFGQKKVAASGRMRYIHEYRKVRFLFQDWHCRNIECVAGRFLVCADTAFTKDDLIISGSDDVFSSIDEFINRC